MAYLRAFSVSHGLLVEKRPERKVDWRSLRMWARFLAAAIFCAFSSSSSKCAVCVLATGFAWLALSFADSLHQMGTA